MFIRVVGRFCLSILVIDASLLTLTQVTNLPQEQKELVDPYVKFSFAGQKVSS